MTITPYGYLGSLAFGAATQYEIDVAGIGGLGTPSVKTADTQFDGRDGSSGAPDFLDIRIITIPLVILGDDDADAMALLDDLNTAWKPARDGVDVELHLGLPGWTEERFWLGRARGVEADVALMKNGTLRALCRFDALDPNYQSGPY